MFDHVGLAVTDFAKSKAFYEKVLAPFGYKFLFGEDGVFAGYGGERPQFWISQGDAQHPTVTGAHVAFSCTSRELVNAFHAAAIAAGGKDNGTPGLRPEYHENYYGAFVHDLDGNNIEAVCHRPE